MIGRFNSIKFFGRKLEKNHLFPFVIERWKQMIFDPKLDYLVR